METLWQPSLQYELGLGEDNLHNTSTKNVIDSHDSKNS
jgi:hypothetical protein